MVEQNYLNCFAGEARSGQPIMDTIVPQCDLQAIRNT
jgi:hypothetical protein